MKGRTFRVGAHERIGCVIDLETVPDPDVVAISSRCAVAGRSRGMLHRAVCGTLLHFAEDRDSGSLRCLSFRTLTLERAAEGAFLADIEAMLPVPDDDSSILVSFAGTMHDLPVLRRRALSLWMFDMPNIRGWNERRASHHDLMYYFGARSPNPSLAEVSALLGANLAGTRSGDPATLWIEKGDWRPIIKRNRNDVAATFIAYAYTSAWRRGSELPVATAWTSFSSLLRGMGEAMHDLREFSHHHMVGLAAKRLAALSGAPRNSSGSVK
ncbi:hypothetical protein [Sphingomonas sp. 22R3R2A-7]|uniref:hypothetical protein n=1 Tax=Sphingomonas sp. 22R3R2A-7 TaxID=3050230 RepID=UPI002FE39503